MAGMDRSQPSLQSLGRGRRGGGMGGCGESSVTRPALLVVKGVPHVLPHPHPVLVGPHRSRMLHRFGQRSSSLRAVLPTPPITPGSLSLSISERESIPRFDSTPMGTLTDRSHPVPKRPKACVRSI
eukprot:3935518-Rhodomonas_salina.1